MWVWTVFLNLRLCSWQEGENPLSLGRPRSGTKLACAFACLAKDRRVLTVFTPLPETWPRISKIPKILSPDQTTYTPTKTFSAQQKRTVDSFIIHGPCILLKLLELPKPCMNYSLSFFLFFQIMKNMIRSNTAAMATINHILNSASASSSNSYSAEAVFPASSMASI